MLPLLIATFLVLFTGTIKTRALNPPSNSSKQNSLIDTASFLVKQFNENTNRRDYDTENIFYTISQLKVHTHIYI
jgi:hypothetical protein